MALTLLYTHKDPSISSHVIKHVNVHSLAGDVYMCIRSFDERAEPRGIIAIQQHS